MDFGLRQRILNDLAGVQQEALTSHEAVQTLLVFTLSAVCIYEYVSSWNMLVLLARLVSFPLLQAEPSWTLFGILQAPILFCQLFLRAADESSAWFLNFIGPTPRPSLAKQIFVDACIALVQLATMLLVAERRHGRGLGPLRLRVDFGVQDRLGSLNLSATAAERHRR